MPIQLPDVTFEPDAPASGDVSFVPDAPEKDDKFIRIPIENLHDNEDVKDSLRNSKPGELVSVFAFSKSQPTPARIGENGEVLIEKPTSGVAGALVRSGLVSAPSALAGAEAMGAVAPLAAGLGPVGRLAVPLIAGAAGGVASSALMRGMMPQEQNRQLEADSQQHPIATTIGGMAGGLPIARPSLSLDLINRAKMAAIGAGTSVGTKVATDPGDLLSGRTIEEAGIAALSNAILNKPTKIGGPIMEGKTIPQEAQRKATEQRITDMLASSSKKKTLTEANQAANKIATFEANEQTPLPPPAMEFEQPNVTAAGLIGSQIPGLPPNAVNPTTDPLPPQPEVNAAKDTILAEIMRRQEHTDKVVPIDDLLGIRRKPVSEAYSTKLADLMSAGVDMPVPEIQAQRQSQFNQRLKNTIENLKKEGVQLDMQTAIKLTNLTDPAEFNTARQKLIDSVKPKVPDIPAKGPMKSLEELNPENFPKAEPAKSEEPSVTFEPDKTDAERYGEIQKSMVDLIKQGKANDPEFMALWKENEDIKNRNEGMPPGQVSGESSDKLLDPNQNAVGVKLIDPNQPPKEPSISDKIIKTLEGAKINKAGSGRVISGDPFSMAWDGAIELAIHAVKTGRAIHEAVKLAVDRFKEAYPEATPQHVKMLEDSITGTHKTENSTSEKQVIKDTIASAEANPSIRVAPDESPGERRSLQDQANATVHNVTAESRNSVALAYRATNNRDIRMANMDNNNPDGPIQNIFGAKADLDHNIEQNLKAEFKDPIKDAIRGKDLDKTSMERVNIYAIDRMNQANPDLPNTHLEDSGVKQSVLEDIRNNGLTPQEQAFYDAARKVLDEHSYPQVAKTMKEVYGADVTKVKDYWPQQRDYSKFDKRPERPQPTAEHGEEAAMDDIMKSLTNDYRPIKTTKPSAGQTIERVKGAGGAVNLSENVIDRHLNQAAHIISHAKDLKLLGSVARSPDFAEKYGIDNQKYILDWLDSVARNSDPVGSTSSPFWNKVIRNTGVGILAIRFLSQGKHISNGVIAAREVGSHLFPGMTESFTPQGEAFIKKNFAEVYQRAGGEEAIAQLISGNAWEKFQGKWFWPERVIDKYLARGTVLGAYMKEMAKLGHDPHDIFDLPVDEGAQYRALVTARKVVTSSLRKDQPQLLSRGDFPIIKGNMTLKNAVTQFQSTMMKNAGYAKHEVWDMGIKKGDYVAAATAAATVLGVLATVSALTLGQKAIMNWIVGSHKKEKHDLATRMAEEIGVESLRQIPVVGPIASAAVTHGQTGIPVVDTYSQGLGALGKWAGLAKDQYGKEIKGRAKDQARNEFLTFAGTAAGIPGASTIGQGMSRSR